ncbi:hypothetical protein BKA65DRAFT_473507 [Rhexocercosporidium sp. MPI-PUGE-AT-0058]|nr:hypothetical protein BKA65DRAFT_473507 [Rhexocercosporidium sp. MPI-PUGE-AT-0058]
MSQKLQGRLESLLGFVLIDVHDLVTAQALVEEPSTFTLFSKPPRELRFFPISLSEFLRGGRQFGMAEDIDSRRFLSIFMCVWGGELNEQYYTGQADIEENHSRLWQRNVVNYLDTELVGDSQVSRGALQVTGFSTLGPEKVGPDPRHSRLLASFPGIVILRKLHPVHRQIKFQINRCDQLRIAVTVKASSTLSESDQKEIRERHGVKGAFVLVFTSSNEERECAMRRLFERGLYFGAPELMVQKFKERGPMVVKYSDEHEQSPEQCGDMEPESTIRCHADPAIFHGALTIRLKHDISKSSGTGYRLDGTRKLANVDQLPIDTFIFGDQRARKG